MVIVVTGNLINDTHRFVKKLSDLMNINGNDVFSGADFLKHPNLAGAITLISAESSEARDVYTSLRKIYSGEIYFATLFTAPKQIVAKMKAAKLAKESFDMNQALRNIDDISAVGCAQLFDKSVMPLLYKMTPSPAMDEHYVHDFAEKIGVLDMVETDPLLKRFM